MYTTFVCEYMPHKKDPNRTRITIGGKNIFSSGDVGTPTSSLELAKLVINSVLSRCNARFASFDISNFYLNNPLYRFDYARACLSDIPDELIEKYNLMGKDCNGWLHFEIQNLV